LMDSKTTRRDKIKKRVENAALDILRPEILGRFNLLDAFSKLGEDSTYRIAEIHAQECLRISRENGHDIVLSENAIDSIRRAGYSERFGARPIKDQAMAIIGNAILSKGIPKVSGTLTYDVRTKRYDIQQKL
jgi:ATP-dependent Clp protease ATP-binding subunit ClpA